MRLPPHSPRWALPPINRKRSKCTYRMNHRRPYQIEWAKQNPEKYLFGSARDRARRENLDFDITLDDIVVPVICPYLKIPLVLKLGQGKLETNPSIDRIDSSKGYVKGNVQVISKKANTMKSNASKEELLTFARSVLDLFA
jgi:hypothetical protein